MAKQSPNSGADKAAGVSSGVKKPHAAGSGSSTGDPGNRRGPQPKAGESSPASQTQAPVTSPDLDPPKD
jgi:hypothetical protein